MTFDVKNRVVFREASSLCAINFMKIELIFVFRTKTRSKSVKNCKFVKAFLN